MTKLSRVLFVFLVFLFSAKSVFAVSDFPAPMKYPEFFKDRDSLNWNNIKSELDFRLNYLRGRYPVPAYLHCHKLQRRIYRTIDRLVSKKELLIDKVDDSLIFGDNPKGREISFPKPKKPTPNCSYHSYGDISRGCVIYCDFHGLDFESAFYKEHKSELNSQTPAIISSDIAEIILFSPLLLLLPLVFFVIFKFQLKPSKR